eukprot:CFRG8512T1
MSHDLKVTSVHKDGQTDTRTYYNGNTMLSDLINRNESGSKYSVAVGTPPIMRRLPRLGSMSPMSERPSNQVYVKETNEIRSRRVFITEDPLVDCARESVEAEGEDLCNWH